MPANYRNMPNNLHKNKELYPLRHLAGRGKEKPFAAPCRQGGRKNLLEKVLSFPPCTPSILFQNFLCSLFHFALHAKMKKRDICFENEEGQEENARVCLLSGMLVTQRRLFLRSLVSLLKRANWECLSMRHSSIWVSELGLKT